MKQFFHQLSAYLLRHHWWVLLSALLAVAYVLMQRSSQLGWGTYWGIVGGLIVLFVPAIALAFARKTRPRENWLRLYWVIWVLAFILLPVLYLLLGVSINDLPFRPDLLAEDAPLNRWGIPLVGGVLLLTELLLGIGQYTQARRTEVHWITRLSVPLLALVVVSVFALLVVMSNNFIADAAAKLSSWQRWLFYLSLVLEIIIIYLPYYLLYYVHHHFLYRKLLLERGFFSYLMGSVALLLILSPIYAQLILFLPNVETFKLHTVGLVPDVFDDINYMIPLSIFILSLPFIVLQEWYRRRAAISELEKEKTATELSLLKQQINPHFFFNTLNNLYAMSLTQDEDTPETILQLSDLMRYVIYEGQKERVPLSAEIKYLQDYLDLQQIRLHQKAVIDFQVDISDESWPIPPLLFIILLENAFKHGVEPAEEIARLEVSLTANAEQLIFYCRNSHEGAPPADKTGGIGLQNLQRRLELLYPQRHELVLRSGVDHYTATLSLNL